MQHDATKISGRGSETQGNRGDLQTEIRDCQYRGDNAATTPVESVAPRCVQIVGRALQHKPGIADLVAPVLQETSAKVDYGIRPTIMLAIRRIG